ncbi:MAG TPA: ATP-dependent zinc metalloprotease FtsH [Acidimicrobiia bacterium]|nr:ATP-dependent zinc metalloprotease FtsH [Acidimicrobiia bacterium]
MPDDKDEDGKPPFGRLPGSRSFWLIALILLAVNFFVSNLLLGPEPRVRVPYTAFIGELESGNVESITSTGETIQGTFRSPIPDPDEESDDPTEFTLFQTERPTWAEDDLLEALRANDVVVNAEPADAPAPLWQQIVFGFGPTLLLLYIFFRIFRRAGSAMGGLGGLGSSRAKRYEDTTSRTTFADVAGIDDAEEELVEIVDFLRNPDKYTRLGGAIPRGVLLSGPPGTGKTLLARAVAGEANVPFFSMAASEFIEMVVGVGASRVRDLFEQAKKVAPSIVFIDELDSIGRSRGGSTSFGGHDEREQTLNQILTEMDGFTGREGVIVLAATNRPEILDQALLRPGRFDRQIVVAPPDQVGRKAILEVHTRKVLLGEDVDLGSIASSTPGMVGADLANLVNEAALMAARRGHENVHQNDFTDALEKVVLGTERRIMMTDEEKRRTAFHEGGHALLGMLREGADPVRKISIIPRGRALGVTFQSPDADRYSYDADYLNGRLIGMLGGRAAEEVVFGVISTGAENDMVQATQIARSMVGRWGMSDKIGPVSVFNEQSVDAFGRPEVSEDTMRIVDAEVHSILDRAYSEAVELLGRHRSQLDALAEALLDKETLDEAAAYEVAGIPRPLKGDLAEQDATPGASFETEGSDLGPIVRRLELDCGPDEAFAAYTGRVGEWWPRGFTASGDALADVVIEGRAGGRIYELATSGEETEWGEVRLWQPGSRLVHSFVLAQDGDDPTEVDLTFEARNGGCALLFEHRGWNAHNRAARSKFDDPQGWDVVLDGFRQLVDQMTHA